MGEFTTISAPPTQSSPGQGGGSSAAAGSDMGAFGGTQSPTSPSQPSPIEQNAGVLDILREISMGFSQVNEFLMGIAQQFPGSAQSVRSVLEAVQTANTGLVDIVQSVTMEAQAPIPAAPRTSY